MGDKSVPWRTAMERLRFQKRICTTFIPKEIDKERCVCNYNHSQNGVSHVNETWNGKEHTKQEPTNDYGTLAPSNSPYLRCDIETEMEQLCFMLLGVWNMPVPGLIMQMISDADSTPNIKIEKELLQGISNAAVASDAWIISSGYQEESTSELIGEVIYNCRITNPEVNLSAIAVGKWGNIHDCHKLEIRGDADEWTTHKGLGRYNLESNHTHYIFFDDGTCDSLDTSKFASDLARQISQGARRRIPLITVLVGGTLHSLSSICTNLSQKIPLVIVNGCGRLGDILCKYLKLTESSYKSPKKKTSDEDDECSDSDDDMSIAMIDEAFSNNEDETLKDVLRPLGKHRKDFVDDMRKLYKVVREEEYEVQGRRLLTGELFNLAEEKTFGRYLYQMASCFQDPFRKNIHIFSIPASKSLKETIYGAFIQARDSLSQMKKKYHKTVDEQVNLALRWGISDVTENQSVTTTKIWNDTNKAKQNRSLLVDALSKNLLVFVMNFVKLDIDFTVLFGPNRSAAVRADVHWSQKYHYLQELYSDKKRKNCDSLYLLDQVITTINFTEEKHLVKVLEKLVGDFMRPLYNDQSKLRSPTKQGADIEKMDAEYVHRDLFLWCILTCRLDMAKIFLSQMKTRICSALIASRILKSLSAYAPDQATRDTLYAKAEVFETYAIEFVRCAYSNDKYQACELIMRRLDLYGGVTCLQMAIAADDKRFLHEDACQALLTNIWYDKVDPVRERNRLIVNILTLGIFQIFSSIYTKYYSNSSTLKQEYQTIRPAHSNRPLKNHGIDYTDDYNINETVFQHFFHFHNRPIVKYCYTCCGYVLLLLLFSFYMLFAFAPLSTTNPNIHWTEILTIITVSTMLFEEVRQFFSQDNRSLMGKIVYYFDINNRISNLCLVFPAYALFYIGLAFRFVMRSSESFGPARIIMALDLEIWYIRSILFVSISSNLGPKIVMIRKMTNDLLLIIIVIIIFIFGYGVTSRAMTAYGTIGFSVRQFLQEVIYPVYYFVHGSFDNERTQLEAKPDASTTLMTQVVFAAHMLFVNILLINLLTALFSFTITDVQTQAHYVWAYDRCDIIRTYHTRPALFPPFTFLISMGQYCRWCWRQFCKRRCTNNTFDDDPSPRFKMIPLNENVDRAWSKFERYSTNSYIRQLLDELAAALASGIMADTRSESAPTDTDELKRIKHLIDDMYETVEGSNTENRETLETMESTIANLESRFDQMETRFDRSREKMEDVMTALNSIMTAMNITKTTGLEPLIIQELSRTNSMSGKHQSDHFCDRSNHHSTESLTKTRQSPLPQEQLTTSEVRSGLDHDLNHNDNA